VPEKVPLWVIENTFAPHGGRMSKRPDLISGDLKVCATCDKELYRFQDWSYCAERYYCSAHIDAARAVQQEVWKREAEERKQSWLSGERGGGYSPAPVTSDAFVRMPRTEAEVPVGNLEEYLYQYWIGCAPEMGFVQRIMSTRSTCRACGTVVFGAMGRAIHKNESSKFYNNDYSCMKVISLAIRDMVGLKNCLVCKNFTPKKHYGVPICSPNCHKVWRFAEKMQYPELELAIAPYWITAGTPETGGSFTSESSLSQIPIVSHQEEQE
jgi:hypothetical protein